METKANYIVIGLFTLFAILGAFGFVYWFQHIGGVGEQAIYRVVFEESAGGLRTGAAVLFNGIRVGEVTDLRLNAENPREVMATISVAATTPIRADTTASLSFQGLTGIASVSLKGGMPAAPPLVAAPGQPPLLVAEKGAGQDVTEAAREVLRRFDAMLGENQASLQAAIKNIDTFSAVLARNSERVDRIMAGLEKLSGGPEGKGEIQETARSIRTLAENLDKRTAELTADGRKLVENLDKRTAELTADGHRALRALERTIVNFDRNPQRLLFGNSTTAPEQRRRR